jgi:folate-binding protein YgfZ
VSGLASVDEGYRALREGVGAYRLPVDVVAVTGPEAATYLQGQLSQDLAPLEVGRSVPALLLEPDGKLTAFLRVTRTADHAYALDTDSGFGAPVTARLRKFKLRTKVDVDALDWPCVALRGAAVTPSGRAAAAPPFELDVEWNGTRGLDLLGPGAEGRVPADATWCGGDAWDALRIEAGIPKMGTELDERTIAAEAHLVERAVSFTKGCFTGQELVARLDARGNRVARRLCGLVVDGATRDAVTDVAGASLWTPDSDKTVGRVTSAAWCPGLGTVGALCYVHRSVEVPATVEWGDGEAGTRRAAEARPLPLVA